MKTFNDFKRLGADYNEAILYLHANLTRHSDEFKEVYKDYLNIRMTYEQGRDKNLRNLEDNHQDYLKNLFDKKNRLIGEIRRYKFILEEGNTKFGKITPNITDRINELIKEVNNLIDFRKNKTDIEYTKKKSSVTEAFDKALSQAERNFEERVASLLNKIRNILQNELAEFWVKFNEYAPTKEEELINEDTTIFSANNYTPLVEIGKYHETIEVHGNRFEKNIRIVLPFIDCNSVLIIHNEETKELADDIHDTLITRTLISTDVGKIKLTLSDMKGVGDFFREFTPLSHQFVHVDNSRVGFEKIMSDCDKRLQEISIKYTSSSKHSDFLSLGEYNFDKILNQKIEEIIPHYISVVLNLSYIKDESLIKELNRLISNGARNGTQFIITWDMDEENQDPDLLAQLMENKDVLIVDLASNKSNYLNIKHKLIPNKIPLSKKHDLVDSYNFQYKELSNKTIKEYFLNKIPDKAQWFSFNSSDLVSIPIGKSKSHRGEQLIDIKTNDFQSHIMLSGGTGSGKTNFLKTFITSAALQYSTDELEFYLIDLKNGIGFDIFRKHKLPHVKMFAMGAENELIYNLLSSLNDEMNKRLNTFTQYGFEDISKFNHAHPEMKFKRTILVIDEFASIFEEDSHYQDEIISKISPLAKKARAVGINLFFSTQNFNHVAHGFTKLMSEIPIRVVLKSSLSAATALLDSRNDAMKFVRTVGDGVLNYQLGVKHVEQDNHLFKGYLLDNDDLEKILIELKRESESRGFIANESIVYNNLSEAIFSRNKDMQSQQRYIEELDNKKIALKPRSYRRYPIWLGEPSTVSKKHFKFDLDKSFNENILVTGVNKQVSINAIYNILASLSYTFASGEIAIRLFSFLNPEETQELKLDNLSKLELEYDYKLVQSEKFIDEFNMLNTELENRKKANSSQSERIFIFFIGLEKAQQLFKEETYSLSNYGIQMSNLLEIGNQYNIHSICEMRQPSILDKILKSNAINFFKHRIVFHLGNSDESISVIDNKMAGTLYKEDTPYTKYRAIYFNSDFEKVYHKIKPYLGLIERDDFFPKNFGKLSNKRTIIPSIEDSSNMVQELNVTEGKKQDYMSEEAEKQLTRLEEISKMLEAIEGEDDVFIKIDEL